MWSAASQCVLHRLAAAHGSWKQRGAKDGEGGWEGLELSSPWGQNCIEFTGEKKNAACFLDQIESQKCTVVFSESKS